MRFFYPRSLGAQVFRKMPLDLLMVVPFVLQIFAAVGLTGWFSLRNGQKAVNELAEQLRSKTSAQVTHYLRDQLRLPHQINQLNLDAIIVGGLDLKNFDQLGRTFYKQMQIFNVGYINFANPQGEFIGVERLRNGALLINERSQRLPNGKLNVYAANRSGDRTRYLAAKPYDPLVEAWYVDAVKAQHPLWSDIYQWNDKPEILSISSSYPVYNHQNRLLGVVGVDLILSELSQFLQTLQISSTGEVFIVEQNGLLVASSALEPPFKIEQGKAQRILATQSPNPLIKATANHLTHHFKPLTQIQTVQQLHFHAIGQSQFVQVTPWQDNHGLNWLVVVVVPESDFMEQIYANTRTTILLCALSLTVAILFGLLTSRWISQRIRHLVQRSQQIANGNLDQTVKVQGIRELEDLSQSFNQMAAQLKTSFAALEERVAQRTAELVEAKNVAESANRTKSQFLESMSHELRTPLNAILGVIQGLQRDPFLTSEHRECLNISHRNGNYLLSLINDLLEIAKLDANQELSANNHFDLELRMKPDNQRQLDERDIDQKLIIYLAQMPPEWLRRLYDSAIKGFDQDIFVLITQIPIEFAPLATTLKAWVKEFRFDKVTDLIQQVEMIETKD